jgi:hypothetical protein
MAGRQQAWASHGEFSAGAVPSPPWSSQHGGEGDPADGHPVARPRWRRDDGGDDDGGAAPRKLHMASSAGSGPTTEMRHERRRTAAHLLAIDPEGATDLGHLRTRFVRRQRTKEAADIFRGGSATNSAASSLSASLHRSDSFNSTTSGFGGGSYRGGGGGGGGGGGMASLSGSFLSNVGLDGPRGNGSTRGSDWTDQWSRGGSWMSRGGSWMSFADADDIAQHSDFFDSELGPPPHGVDSLVATVEAAKQQLLMQRAAFHEDEIAQVLQKQQRSEVRANLPDASSSIAEAEAEYRDNGKESASAAGPSVDSKELLEHPQRMPNLLRASSTCVVGLVSCADSTPTLYTSLATGGG